jgi:pimeloyl-ACP methyl ester carboxylesterase
MMRPDGFLSVVLLVTTLLSDCGMPGRSAGRVPLRPCHLEHLAEEVLCGEHDVFEDRSARSGRRLQIRFAVLPALRRPVRPDPLFVFAGGPGQGARAYAGLAARFFKGVRRTREIVLVDLRGTGDSHALTCTQPADELDQLAVLTDTVSPVGECVRELDADPRQYTHLAALADVDDIRQGLGYDRINLWGGSWGTRAALLFALSYPHAVRSVVLDGAVPLDMEFPRSAAFDAERAMELLRGRCAADLACAAAFPSMRGALDELLTRFHRPSLVGVRHPRTGQEVSVLLSRELVAEMVRALLYSPSTASLLPEILRLGVQGDYGPLLASWVRLSAATVETMAIGATLSVLCSEDLPGVSDVDFTSDARASFAGSGYADRWRSWCRAWPVGPGLTANRVARSAAPALILSGAHDPVTPPRWGERMARYFPNHLALVVQAAAHNTSFSGCVPDVIAAFIERGDALSASPPSIAQEATCLDHVTWPPFALGRAGSQP